MYSTACHSQSLLLFLWGIFCVCIPEVMFEGSYKCLWQKHALDCVNIAVGKKLQEGIPARTFLNVSLTVKMGEMC